MAFEDILITEIQETKIKDKAPDKLPLNPTAQGWTGQQVRAALSNGTFGNTDSVLSEVKSKLTIIKDYFDANQEQVDDIVGDIEDLQDGASLKLAFYGKANENITKGDFLMFGGVQGDHILLVKADLNASGFIPEFIVGVAETTLLQGEFGRAIWFGELSGLPIDEPAGTLLYVGQTPGTYVVGKPATGPKILMAVVEKQRTGNASNGEILIRPSLGSSLSDLNDVAITEQQDGDILRYDGQTSKYVNVKSNKIVVSDTEPSQNKDNDLWFDI
jgi:hypothetical protein